MDCIIFSQYTNNPSSYDSPISHHHGNFLVLRTLCPVGTFWIFRIPLRDSPDSHLFINRDESDQSLSKGWDSFSNPFLAITTPLHLSGMIFLISGVYFYHVSEPFSCRSRKDHTLEYGSDARRLSDVAYCDPSILCRGRTGYPGTHSIVIYRLC